MRHYWGLAVGHTYARISTAAAKWLYFKHPHRSGESVELPIEELPDASDEESELGEDDMVYIDDDRDWDTDSDKSSIYGLERAE